jgi:hypothetical protein
MPRPAHVRQRNRLTAIAICCMAATFVFYKNQAGVQWFPWRDAPLLAIALATVALVCALLAWRARRV